MLKLNTDGCSKENPGSAGGGVILRDDKGQLIMAYATFFGECANNVAESHAILIGLRWCINMAHIIWDIVRLRCHH